MRPTLRPHGLPAARQASRYITILPSNKKSNITGYRKPTPRTAKTLWRVFFREQRILRIERKPLRIYSHYKTRLLGSELQSPENSISAISLMSLCGFLPTSNMAAKRQFPLPLECGKALTSRPFPKGLPPARLRFSERRRERTSSSRQDGAGVDVRTPAASALTAAPASG